MRGKTVVITGSNSGIGKDVAKSLAEMGARIIMACRNKEKALQAAKDIQNASGSSRIEFIPLDLCSNKSIRSFANTIFEKKIEIDVLVNNAGVLFLNSNAIPNGQRRSADGVAVEFAANYLGHYLLTDLLLDNLTRNNARVVNVTSSLHHIAELDFSDIESVKSPHIIAYARSKLAQIYHAKSIQKHFDGIVGCKATINAVHPGYIASNIVEYLPSPIVWLFKALWSFVHWDTSSGAAPIIHLVTSPTYEGVGGQYFSRMKMTKSSKVSYDRDVGQRLWNVSKSMVVSVLQ
ncbi:hypothetical protein PROFUN_14407 [Planoprotostelium fungivorum]|uniref:Retinol dehydrogenase 12-like n=1 Tax=Planoprotostelium fungivorum TaxID=1890364 RepID=A0A2P6MTD5_9EUKA|nr:hypothetical protein PROFUN_16023 [Planoprotostelium fungivorum]PRP76301.1 hypothetical protein PROFUN_14407 [Planoprotostelium fungivorum]